MNILIRLDYFDTKVYNKNTDLKNAFVFRGDHVKDFMTRDFNISRILVACSVRAGEGTPVHTNRVGHGLVLYLNDSCRFDFGDQKLCPRKNDIIYLPKGSSYTVESINIPRDLHCYAINFDLSEQVDFPPFIINVKNAASILSLFKQSEQVWRAKRAGYQMECKANLYHIICELQKEFSLGYVSSATVQKIEPAISYIHQNYTDDNISIAHLAALCEMSETYFRTIFKKTLGRSPLKYINDLKIERAKELLASRLYSTADAAFLSGYHDECYFSREFKKAVGIAPSKYAEEASLHP